MSATAHHPDQDVLPRHGTLERAMFLCRVTDATIAARLSIPRPADEVEGLRALQLGVRDVAVILRQAVEALA